MTNTVSKFYQDLYDEAVESKADYAGDLAAMAFVAHDLLRIIELGRIDGVQGQNRIGPCKRNSPSTTKERVALASSPVLTLSWNSSVTTKAIS